MEKAQTQYQDYILEIGSYRGNMIQLVKVACRVFDGFQKLYKEVSYMYEVRVNFINKSVPYKAKNYIFESLESATAFFNIKIGNCEEVKRNGK